MNRPHYEDLDGETQAKINGAVSTFLRGGGQHSFAEAIDTLGMDPQELWSMIMSEAGLPDCVPPFMVQVGYNH